MSDSRTRYASSVERYGRAQRSLAAGVSSNFRLGGKPTPLFFKSGSGARLLDVDGNTYIDYVLGMGPAILGHAPTEVIAAVQESLAEGQLVAGQTEVELELAELVQALVPCAERVRFGMSGSEMIHAALRIARAGTGRARVIKFEGHYHGWFDSIYVSVSPPKEHREEHRNFPQSQGQILPTTDELVVLPWNDIETFSAYVDSCAGDVAAVIMEPILCNTGVILPAPGFLESVRATCTKFGIVLIFDEVITGFRVALGGAQELLGVTPDLAVFAKAMGGGFPIAALAGRADLMDLTSGAVVHGGTYNGNRVSVTAALATLRGLAAEHGAAYRAMEHSGKLLMSGLRDVGDEFGLHVQGLATVFNTTFAGPQEIVDYPGYVATDLNSQSDFVKALQDRGVRVTARGTWFLSAVHDEHDVEATLAAAADTLRDVASAGPGLSR